MTKSNTLWNTDLPTQLVVGWTRVDKVTDEQIATLLDDLDAYATAYANELWRNHNATLRGLPTGIPDQMAGMTALVRHWIAGL